MASCWQMSLGSDPLIRRGCARPHALPGCGRRTSFRLSQGRPATGNGRSLAVSIAPGAPGQGPIAAVVPQAPVSTPDPECSPPATTFQKIAAQGAAKTELSWTRLIGLAVLGGAYISFGALFALSVGCCLPGMASANPGLQRLVLGIFGLPLGLILVMLTGVELFTGNTMIMTFAACEGLATPGDVIKSWVGSFIGNFIGSVLMVALMGVTGLAVQKEAAAGVAVAKTSLTFMQAFSRGIIANWLVNLAIWLASSSSSLGGKIIGAIVPVTAFTAMGMEHSVANMSLIPMGLAIAGVTYRDFWLNNLLPVVLGNIVGGAVCMGLALSWAHGKPKATA